ncbi:gluconokinase [Actinoallomurus rhizosphaericola]|uniref:gluconokinase n=1 Tax=Actinoallomurus rhizosphaericola TaxID=2952536 RepID=UPI002090DB89|nr:gluconokinase [Actinoallomurus rhizosphaericola]MCO5994008.1 gluconokinase [Actinoallomurus rhizosphaericola]
MQNPIVLIMGVSGSGKTTIGAMLAGRLGWKYAEADDFHPPANVEKMHAGIPLTDEDRWPWLRAIATWMAEQTDPAVVTCSALKRKYRDVLREPRPDARLVYLDGSKELIAARLAARHGHFFPRQLLDSQFADLEPPAPDEDALAVSIDQPIEAIVEEIHRRLDLPDGPSRR